MQEDNADPYTLADMYRAVCRQLDNKEDGWYDLDDDDFYNCEFLSFNQDKFVKLRHRTSNITRYYTSLHKAKENLFLSYKTTLKTTISGHLKNYTP